jgi:hypothetical protein
MVISPTQGSSEFLDFKRRALGFKRIIKNNGCNDKVLTCPML